MARGTLLEAPPRAQNVQDAHFESVSGIYGGVCSPLFTRAAFPHSHEAYAAILDRKHCKKYQAAPVRVHKWVFNIDFSSVKITAR